MQVVQAEVHKNPELSNIVSVDTEESEKESESTHQQTNKEDQLVVEFEDQAYKIDQMYQLEQEYHEMTLEQEAEAVQALIPLEQAEHRELTMLHRRQAKMEKEIMGLSQIVKERAKTKAPRLPIDLVQRSVKTEAPERQELHKLMEAQHIRVMTKQDEIPRTEKPGTCHGYYLFVEDDAGYLVEQRDKEGNIHLMKDTDTDRVLPTDYITEAQAETYQIPKKDQQPIEDNAETLSSMSTADYDWEEVETSLTTLADAFHTIGQEYERLVGIVPHMSKVQVVNMVA